MTKKVLAVSLVLCVMFAASSAIAQPRRPMQPPMPPMPPHEAYGYYDYGYAPQGWNHQPQNFERPERFGRRDFRPEFGPREFSGRFDPDMPDKPELPSLEGKFPANDSVRPPMPPKGERMRPPKGSFDMKPPADFKPGDMKIPPVKK